MKWILKDENAYMKTSVKLWFTNMYSVGFYFVPNLIVIIFNLLYPVFIMGFDCMGCMIERECEDLSNWSQKISCRYLVTKHSAKWSMCLAHDWNAKSQYRWRQLCFASSSRVRPSRETPAKHFVLLDCTIWYTLSVPTLYIPILPTNFKECFWEKTLAKHLES